ncbi:hypothetical protein LXL04_008749 [Taraxacum kok-saghyz]
MPCCTANSFRNKIKNKIKYFLDCHYHSCLSAFCLHTPINGTPEKKLCVGEEAVRDRGRRRRCFASEMVTKMLCVGDGLSRKRPEKKVCVAARSRGRRKLEQGRVGGRRISRRKSPVEERKRVGVRFEKK